MTLVIILLILNDFYHLQVTTQNPAQQAEPHNDILENSMRRIQSRPPIHGQLTPTVAKPTPKTPSRLPVPITQTPKPIRTTALTPIPHHVESIGAMPLSVAARRTPIVSETPMVPRIVVSPPTVIPAPPANVTVNVNVNNSIPQSPLQGTQTVQKSDRMDTLHIRDENDKNNGNASNGRLANAQSTSNNSLLTDDDSEEIRSNASERCETPKIGASNDNVSRKLFPEENDQYRRSATYDRIPSPLPNQQQSLSFRTRSTNAIAPKNQNIGSPATSETFVKQKTLNATYDIPKQNASYRNSRTGNETDEFPSSYVSNSTNNTNVHRNTLGNGLNLPSEALINMDTVSINLTEDNEINVNNANGSNDSRKSYPDKLQNNTDWNPTVLLHRMESAPHPASQSNTSQSIGKLSTKRKSSFQLSDSQPLILPPPDAFQNDDIIVEGSPTSSLRDFEAVSKLFDGIFSFIQVFRLVKIQTLFYI